jgi:hypothetical protein
MNDGLRRPTWRQSVSVLALVAAAGCAGSGSPTSPSLNAGAGTAGVQAASQQQTGTAGTVFVEVQPGVFGFAAAVEDGVTGRNVQLTGDIVGINFEPGTCVAGVDMSLGFQTSCVVFGEGPGQFVRAHPGGTGFTTCHCTVGGVGDPGDQVTLRISYPPATPPQYPFGFTKFTFQDGTGELAGLRGQGTLDFASNPAVSFNYHFVGAQ